MRKLHRILLFLLVLPLLGPVPAGLHDFAEVLESEGLAALEAGEWRVAENRFRGLLDLTDRGVGADTELVRCLFGLGMALVMQGAAGESRALYDRGLRILRRLEWSDSRPEADAYHGLARGALLEEKRGRARSFLMRERALRAERADAQPLALARTLRELGRLGDSASHPGIAVTWVGDEAGRWVYGFAVGSASRDEARKWALARCERRVPWHRVDRESRSGMRPICTSIFITQPSDYRH